MSARAAARIWSASRATGTGNFPIVYFFPDLNRTTLRIFKEYQRPDGETAFELGPWVICPTS